MNQIIFLMSFVPLLSFNVRSSRVSLLFWMQNFIQTNCLGRRYACLKVICKIFSFHYNKIIKVYVAVLFCHRVTSWTTWRLILRELICLCGVHLVYFEKDGEINRRNLMLIKGKSLLNNSWMTWKIICKKNSRFLKFTNVWWVSKKSHQNYFFPLTSAKEVPLWPFYNFWL